MTKTYRRRDNLIEDRCLKLQSKELGIMWEQSRIQIPLDGGKVERVVLKSRMVAHDNNGKYSESGEQREVFRWRIATLGWATWPILPDSDTLTMREPSLDT